ncbi:alpha/beta hydrolase-fold protein [Paludibacter jiangxiensis]|nr:alpha/beta hydrolase-fold protein [Paludibacter jiangxiensis]
MSRKRITLLLVFCNVIAVSTILAQSSLSGRSGISFGTTLDPQNQIRESQTLAKSLANSNSPQWKARGDQKRFYHFPEANADVPYRVCVPSNWDGKSKLPLVMFLHGGWNDESSYLDQNDKQLVKLADKYGYLLVSPLGYHAAYGNSLLLPAVFGQPYEAAKILAARTATKDSAQVLSEKDVINVLELVLNEYPVDRKEMFLIGHSMGSGGTWYLGAKYHNYWKALAPMSGPFLQEKGYPWNNIRRMSIFISEGTKATASLAGSRALRDWMRAQGFNIEYKEVDADHPGMVPLILPDVFDFLDRCRSEQ